MKRKEISRSDSIRRVLDVYTYTAGYIYIYKRRKYIEYRRRERHIGAAAAAVVIRHSNMLKCVFVAKMNISC